jgi:rubredoxin
MTESLHLCAACGYEYEQSTQKSTDFHLLPDEWQCPGCGIDKMMFHHYACQDMVTELTGKLPPQHPFNTVELPHLR